MESLQWDTQPTLRDSVYMSTQTRRMRRNYSLTSCGRRKGSRVTCQGHPPIDSSGWENSQALIPVLVGPVHQSWALGANRSPLKIMTQPRTLSSVVFDLFQERGWRHKWDPSPKAEQS